MTSRKVRKLRRGVVVSNKMNKSVVVLVEELQLHRKYHKYIKRSKNFMAHDENNECLPGDVIDIVETRPLSKLKRWRVSKIVNRPVGQNE